MRWSNYDVMLTSSQRKIIIWRRQHFTGFSFQRWHLSKMRMHPGKCRLFVTIWYIWWNMTGFERNFKFRDENIIGNETIFFIIDSWDDICSFRSSISSLWTFLLYSNSSLSVSIFLSKSTLTIVASSTSRIFVKKDRFWSKMVDFWQKKVD